MYEKLPLNKGETIAIKVNLLRRVKAEKEKVPMQKLSMWARVKGKVENDLMKLPF